VARGLNEGQQTAEEPSRESRIGRWGRLFSRAGKKSAERLRDAAQDLGKSPALQHGLAAQERGNLEAAFWLLAEEFGDRPDDAAVTLAYWNVAVSLQKVDLASSAGVELVHQHTASGEVELAAQYWLELISAAPDVFVSPTALASILPELRRLLGEAATEDRMELQGLVRRAMRHAVDPRNQGLHPGVALRLFEEGRDLNPEAARRAAEVALDSPNLHEAKRARLHDWLSGGRDPAKPVAAPEQAPAPNPAASSDDPPATSSRLRVDPLSEAEVAAAAARLPPSQPRAPTPPTQEAQDDNLTSGDEEPAPVALDPPVETRPPSEPKLLEEPAPMPLDPPVETRPPSEPKLLEEPAPMPLDPPVETRPPSELKLLEATPTELGLERLELQLPDGGRLAVPYPSIEALCVVEVAGLAEQPVAIIDLLLNWSRQDGEPLKVVRIRGDALEGTDLVPGSCVAGGQLAAFLGEVLLRSRAVPLPDPESALGLRLTSFESLESYEHEVLLGFGADAGQ
jgi:hypothetical protein